MQANDVSSVVNVGYISRGANAVVFEVYRVCDLNLFADIRNEGFRVSDRMWWHNVKSLGLPARLTFCGKARWLGEGWEGHGWSQTLQHNHFMLPLESN